MTSRRQSGVTLIELMIAVAIVAILTAIAYPSYQRYVARTHRDAAAGCMSQYVQFMERFYTSNMRYNGTGFTAPSLPCRQENSLDRRYTVQLRSSTATAYTIEAIPTQLQSAADPLQCGTLAINNFGTRTPTNNECWR
jgi:type IV pilus assembly protein PilE